MNYFKNGDKIEISSDDEGFRGSWYSGTLIKKLNKGKVLVEYNTVLSDGVGQRRLREELDVVLLRPPPPRERHRKFKLNEEVDAYHHDGWWEGVITGALKDGRFVVYFRSNGEEGKYRPSELRLHREWVDYQRWVPPLQEEEAAEDKEVSTPEKMKPMEDTLPRRVSTPRRMKPVEETFPERVSTPRRMKPVEETFTGKVSTPRRMKPVEETFTGKVSTPRRMKRVEETFTGKVSTPKRMKPVEDTFTGKVSTPKRMKPVQETFLGNFSNGAQVEVRSDEEGFEGAWLPATIIRQLKKGNFEVQYQRLKNDENTGPLTEEAEGRNIRPQPPKSKYVDCFKVRQRVDALYNDCWWEGVISKVLKDKKYVVYFCKRKEKTAFKHCDLRQHQDWIDGKWIVPS